MSNEWYPVGGNGGLPSDMLTNFKIGQRRLKTSSRDEIAEVIKNGFAYSFTGSHPAEENELISVNLHFASDVFIRKITTNPGFKIEIFSGHSSGSPDGLMSPHNLNQVSSDVSPATAQIYYESASSGDRLEVGYSEIDPYIFTNTEYDTAVVITNNSGASEVVDFVIIYEEVGSRLSSFGLTPSTELTPTTEMSQYG